MLTYNHERYLAEAVEGVIRQQASFPIELLIGEDCSTDGTREVALGYHKRFPEIIRVITSEQNVGMHQNAARVIAAARGKYIAFCEGDDFWHRPDKLQRQVEDLEAHPCASMVCSDHRVVSDAGCVLMEHYYGQLNTLGMRLHYDDLVLGRAGISTLTVCARRTLVQAASRESLQCRDHTFLLGDLPLWLELSRSGMVDYLPEPLASYRLSLSSATRSQDPLWSRKFAMSVCEVRYQFLEKYSLHAGLAETREKQAALAREILFGAAIIGETMTAKTQVRRLKRLPGSLHIQDYFLYVLARLPMARRIGLVVEKNLQGVCRRRIAHSIRKLTTIRRSLTTADD
jgi:glycosyltransferase involved in cell wall biosynthesis